MDSNAILKVLLKNSSIKMKELSMNDGVTTIEAEKFEKGTFVNILAPDERLIALPVGLYTLDNGNFLEVIEEGVINYYGKEKPTNSAILKALRNRVIKN